MQEPEETTAHSSDALRRAVGALRAMLAAREKREAPDADADEGDTEAPPASDPPASPPTEGAS